MGRWEGRSVLDGSLSGKVCTGWDCGRVGLYWMGWWEGLYCVGRWKGRSVLDGLV